MPRTVAVRTADILADNMRRIADAVIADTMAERTRRIADARNADTTANLAEVVWKKNAPQPGIER